MEIQQRRVAVSEAPRFLYRQLISDRLWERLVGRVAKNNEDISSEQAEEIVDATLGFLKLCAECPDHQFVPSRCVDAGWHTFLLYTREYYNFCERVGHFVHHEPSDGNPLKRPAHVLADTVRFMDEHEVPYSCKMWERAKVMGADCSSNCCACGVLE